MGFKDLFFKSEEPKELLITPESSPIQPQKIVQDVTYPQINGVPDDKFINMLKKVISDQNMSGVDYFEFKQGLDNMSNLPIDETTKFVTVYSILSGQGCSKETLLKSIDNYVNVINNEHETFKAEMTTTFKEKVENPKSKIEDAQKKIIEMSDKIKELNDFIISTTQEVQQEEMKLRLAEANFKQSVEKVTSDLTSDKEKITNYIK